MNQVNPKEASTKRPAATPSGAPPASPARLLALLMAIIFAIELSLMLVFDLLPKIPVWIETLLDASILVVLLFPSLYLLVFRPLQKLIGEHKLAREDLDVANARLLEDIAERKKVETDLRLAGQVFENTLEGIMITDAQRNILNVNDTFSRITGYSREEVLGKNPRFLQSGHHGSEFYAAMWQAIARSGQWSGEIWNRKKDGNVFPELLNISSITDFHGRIVNYVGIFSDITQMKRHQQQLERTAHYDALTGIPNRVLLADRMKLAIAQSHREQTMLALCYLDLDGFKAINDRLGHEAGDRVLVEVARRIQGAIRGGDTVARLGGDEFVVLLPGLTQIEECAATVERLLATIASPIPINGQAISFSTSIGVSVFPLDNQDADTLLRHADQAMYAAKQSGKNRYCLYDLESDKRTRAHYGAISRIGEGLSNNEFELFYQPQVDMRSRRPVGGEALIRWRHPERGLLPPAEFLHAIENSDLDIRLGEWVVGQALDQLEAWQRAGLSTEISINVSAHHLQSRNFVANLRQQLAGRPRLPAGRLEIEVVETAALDDISRVTEVIESCRELGIGFALDDFGTGYSSLMYLNTLPVDTLKIDQSFVRDMLQDKGDFAIVQGIIGLAQAFDRKTVAEGVETERHYEALLNLGCKIGQGYGIARPMPAEQFKQWCLHSPGSIGHAALTVVHPN